MQSVGIVLTTARSRVELRMFQSVWSHEGEKKTYCKEVRFRNHAGPSIETKFHLTDLLVHLFHESA